MTKRVLLFFILALLILTAGARAAVTLKYFRVAQVSAAAVKLEWETATELDHVMFALSRADEKDGDYQTLETFPAEGDAVSGAYYSFTDTSVAPGHTYWYKLEDLDVNGVLSDSAPPIAVHVPAEGEPTPTSTPTATITPTPTPLRFPTPAGSPPPAPGRGRATLLLIVGLASLAGAAILGFIAFRMLR